MGKGAGNICGKSTSQQEAQAPVPEAVTAPSPVIDSKPAPQAPVATPPPAEVTKATEKSKMGKIYIIFYSMYGHVYQMAQKVKEGVDAVEGFEGVLYQVAETLPAEVLEKMHAPPKPDVPIIQAKDMPDADGFIFGIPTRFGSMASQMKAFFDSTGQLWQSGALVGKPAAFFVSTACQGGGQEVTVLTSVTQLAAHGMIFVPLGFSFGAGMFNLDAVQGGSAWGAGTFAGATGARQPTEHELGLAKHQGTYFTKVAAKLAAA